MNVTQELSRLIGVGVNKLLGWRIDLKNPELEVGDYFLVIPFLTDTCKKLLFYPEYFLLFFR